MMYANRLSSSTSCSICLPETRVHPGPISIAVFKVATVLTENSVRAQTARVTSVREIIVISTMSPVFIALLALLTSTFRTRAALQAEILALRHQIAILQQSAPRRLRLKPSDRLHYKLD